MYKKIICIMCLLLLSACTKQEESKEKVEVCSIDCEEANMDGYEGFENKDGIFLSLTMDQAVEMIEAKDTFVLYIGFEDCPWCIEALPILNDVAKQDDKQVYYVDTRADGEDIRNEENDAYVFLQSYFEPYLAEDKIIYVPAVIAIENGEVQAYHEGTVDGHDAHERQLTEDEKDMLKSSYEKLMQSMQ